MKYDKVRALGDQDTWLIRDISTDSELEMRHYHPSPKTRELLLKELEEEQMLNHPNIQATLEVGEDREGVYAMRPYSPNGNCQRYAGCASEQLELKLEKDIRAGLDYLHGRGLYHGKLCLKNIVSYRGHYVLTNRALKALGEHASEEDDRRQLACLLYELREGHQPPAGFRVDAPAQDDTKPEPHPLSTVKDDEVLETPQFEDRTRDDRIPTKSPKIDIVHWLSVAAMLAVAVVVICGIVLGVRALNNRHIEALHEQHIADSLAIEAHEDSINPIPKPIRVSMAYLDTAVVWDVQQVPDTTYANFVRMFHQGRVTDMKNSPLTPKIQNKHFVNIMKIAQEMEATDVRDIFVRQSRHDKVKLDKIEEEMKWSTR